MTVQRMLPLYEAKMIHHYDHRWATYDNARDVRDVTLAEKKDASFEPLPRYWVRESLVEDKLKDRWDESWLLGWRDICRATDERTSIFGRFPVVGVGHTMPLALSQSSAEAFFLYANLTSFVLDYAARQKIGGTHLTYGYLTQLPLLSPQSVGEPCLWAQGFLLGEWISARTSELRDTSRAMQDESFRWDVKRRFWMRAELDAAFFHLYGVEREDVDYIMETFPIVKRKDVAAHGEYRTKQAILEIYDAMQRAIDSGTEYQTVLDPPPGQGPRHEGED